MGAIKALANERLAIAGVAGSSAGAIVAALLAVGYTADELYASDGSRHALGDKKPIDLLGRGSWRRYRFLRFLALPLLVIFLAGLVGSFLAPIIDLGSWELIAPGSSVASVLLLLWLAWPVVARGGLFGTRRMIQILDELLLTRLNDHLAALNKPLKPGSYRVRFSDLDPERLPQCVRLKVIVSDLQSQQLKIFDHSTPHASVADAVAASAAIPYVLRPPTINGSAESSFAVYADGGLVSNLPAWCFRAEKRALERTAGLDPIPIIAFTLNGEEGACRQKAMTPWTYLLSVINTGIFGSQRVVQDFVQDLRVIPLKSPLKTLAFNCSRMEATNAYAAGLRTATDALRSAKRLEEVTRLVLANILKDVDAMIRTRRASDGRSAPRLRAALVDPDPSETTFRVVASAGMTDHSDDRLELDQTNVFAPAAYRSRKSMVGTVAGRSARMLAMTKYDHALVERSVHSIICIPVFPGIAGAMPERVFCLDSTDCLQADFNDPAFLSTVRDLSVATSHSLIKQMMEG